jgi:hypothetical protein
MTTPALDDGLGYHDRIPLAWEALQDAPSVAELSHWQDHNLRLLAALALLEERPRKSDPDEPLTVEVERLHCKFDLLLEMLAVLLRQQQPLPPSHAVRITLDGIAWKTGGADVPPRVLLQLHLHHGLPAPLLWPGERLSGEGEQPVVVRFLPLGDACGAALERHIFTRHRRSVAEARSPAARADAHAAP